EKDEIFDPITQVYRDCQFENNIFYAKNVGMYGISSLPFGHWRIQVYKKLFEHDTSHEAAEKIAIGTRLPEKY
ncbi:20832_t:CDS:2, partial [Rhizophagus irregularis]